jgi:hypothetical protein
MQQDTVLWDVMPCSLVDMVTRILVTTPKGTASNTDGRINHRAKFMSLLALSNMNTCQNTVLTLNLNDTEKILTLSQQQQ